MIFPFFPQEPKRPVHDITVAGKRVAQTGVHFLKFDTDARGNTHAHAENVSIVFRAPRPGEDTPKGIAAWDAKGPGGDAPFWMTLRQKEVVVQDWKNDWKPGWGFKRVLFPGRGFVMEATFLGDGGVTETYNVLYHLRFDPTQPFQEVVYGTGYGPAHSSLFARPYPLGKGDTGVFEAHDGEATAYLDRPDGCAFELYAARPASVDRNARVALMAKKDHWGIVGHNVEFVSIRPVGRPEKVRVLGSPFERRTYDLVGDEKRGGPNVHKTIYAHFRPDGSGFAVQPEDAKERADYATLLKG